MTPRECLEFAGRYRVLADKFLSIASRSHTLGMNQAAKEALDLYDLNMNKADRYAKLATGPAWRRWFV